MGIFYALLATSLSNLGMGFQKAGIDWMKERRLWQFAIWVLGIVMCVVAPFCLHAATQRVDTATVAALGAFGLLPLYLFSRFALKEPMSWAHYLALTAVMAGVVLVGLGQEHGLPEAQSINVSGLAWGCGLCLAVPLIGAVVVGSRHRLLLGLALGCLAGVFAGFALIAIKVGEVLNNGWVSGVGWIAVSILNFVILQVAYQKGTAVQVVPANTALALLVPILVAPGAFGEPITATIVGGTLAIMLGVAFLGKGESLVACQDSPQGDIL